MVSSVIAPLVNSEPFTPIPTQASYSLFSQLELKELSDQFIQSIRQSRQILGDPLSQYYMQSLGKHLTQHNVQAKQEMQFLVIKNPRINAYAGPGGYILVSSGLILSTTRESELAAVLAHEISHIKQQHLLEQLQYMKQIRIPFIAASLATIALGAINPILAGGAMLTSMVSMEQHSLNMTRKQEQSADRFGIKLLAKAGFDPNGMIHFLEKLQQQNRYYDTNDLPILRTHPLDRERIADAKHRVAQYSKQYQTSSLDYQLFRERIRVLTHQVQPSLNYYQKESDLQQTLRPALQYGQALAFNKGGHYKKAQQLLQDLLNDKPNNIHYQLALADSYVGQQKLQNALTILNKLHRLYPEHYPILVAYGSALLENKQSVRAQQLLQRASYHFKNSPVIWHLLAKAYGADQQLAKAHFAHAQALSLVGNPQEAVRHLHQAEQLAKDKPLLFARIQARLVQLNKSTDTS